MGVVTGNVLGNIRGKVGQAVFSTWKDKKTVRAYAPPSNPQTPGQTAQRSKVRAAGQLGSQMLGIYVRPLLNRWSPSMSGYNAFMKFNTELFDEDGLLTDPTLFAIGKGDLTTQSMGVSTADASTGQITINWSNNSGTGTALGTDLIYVAVYNNTQNKWVFMTEPSTRQTEQIVIVAPSGFMADGDELYVFMAAKQATGSNPMVSDTTYKTIAVVA